MLTVKAIEEEVARSELDSSEIKLLEKIGKGSYGVVYKGRLRGLRLLCTTDSCTGKEVAVKKLYESKLDENTMESFKKEVAIMRFAVATSLLNIKQTTAPKCIIVHGCMY